MNELKQITATNNNWNLWYDTESKYIWSIAIPEAKNDGCSDTTYGSIKHLISIIYNYGVYKQSDFTAYGWNLILDYLKETRYTVADLMPSYKGGC